jgi:hypothetical protein
MSAPRHKSAARHKPPKLPNFTKRRTKEERWDLIDAARRATQRLYCDVLKLWWQCRKKPCRRHRHCLGEPYACLLRGLTGLSPAQMAAAQAQVSAGGPRRIAAANHDEWTLRRVPLLELVWLKQVPALPPGGATGILTGVIDNGAACEDDGPVFAG